VKGKEGEGRGGGSSFQTGPKSKIGPFILIFINYFLSF
jgi:hypothetical protein